MAWLDHRVAAGWLAAIVLVAGCGGGAGSSDQGKAMAAVSAFFAAVADDQGDAACVRLTLAGVQQISAAAFLLRTPGTCQDAIKALNLQLSSSDKKSLKSADVTRVTISGARATVAQSDIQIKVAGHPNLFRSSDPGPIRLEKVAGEWKISSLG
jgi:hypothetical protein